MNRYLSEISGIALRCLFIAGVIGVLWLGCRMVWE